MKMKHLLFILLLSNMSLMAQDFKTPVDYLSYIDKEQDQISRSMWKYTTTAAHSKSVRRIENIRKQLIKSIQTASKKIADLKDGYKGDIEYRDKILSYLSISEKNINEEYSKIIDMQEVAEKSYDDMEAYLMARDLVNNKMNEEHEKVSSSQKQFADKYNITLTESDSELSRKMKQSNEVIDYHTVIYLIFFKANYTENNLTKAIEEKNIGTIQQTANALIQYVDDGLAKLQSITAYNKDASFLNNTKKALEFYKKSAQIYTPKAVNFFMYNDKFENAREVMESKSKKDLLPEEIENYNKMVVQINNEITIYNNATNTNNQEKNNMLNSWNSTSESFISSHIPE